MKQKTTSGKNMKKKIILSAVSVIAALILVVGIPFVVLAGRTAGVKTDYSYLKNDPVYGVKASVSGVELVTQHVSCGYATIEMLSSFYGAKITEDELSEKNGGKITTSSTSGFLKEISRTLPGKTFVKKTYLKNDELLKNAHDSLAKGDPVAIEWAAEYEGEWTLHFSVVVGLDIAGDKVTILNPYGYEENITVDEFIARTTFEAYENMPGFLAFGFAFGAFDKNAIFYAA